MADLTSLLNLYRRGDMGKKELEERIVRFILENPGKFYLANWTNDRRVDCIAWVYPRLSKAIDTYKDKGTTFESYLATLLYWSSREYRSRDAEHGMVERACWEARCEDMFACDEMGMYGMFACVEEEEPLRNVSGRTIKQREILILLCKSYWFVSDSFLERIAPVIGMKHCELQKLMDRMRQTRETHDEGVRKLIMGIHSQYYRCICLEKRLKDMRDGETHYERLTELRRKARLRLASMKRRLSGLRVDASNRQVAEVLGIPTGTVDSTLYKIKRKYGDVPAVNM